VVPGQKISARSVADSAQVSFTPAREAVARLISEGALEQAGPKTVIVPTLSRADVDEIYKIRNSTESLACELAASNCTEDDIASLEALQEAYEKTRTSSNFKQSLALNEQIHFKIYYQCGLPRLVNIIDSLWTQIGPSFNLLNSDNPLPESPHEFHRNLIDGLRDKDIEKVRKAITKDLGFGHQRLCQLFNDRQDIKLQDKALKL